MVAVEMTLTKLIFDFGTILYHDEKMLQNKQKQTSAVTENVGYSYKFVRNKETQRDNFAKKLQNSSVGFFLSFSASFFRKIYRYFASNSLDF